jgi:transposase InsO family protein
MARLVVTAVKVEGRSKGEVARTYGISRRWVHELVKRFEVEGEAGLQPRSRRPWTSPQQVSQAVEDEIVALRKTLSEQGLDAGAVTIAAHLTIRHGATPAPSTIWRVLSRRGFVTPQPRKRPRTAMIRFQADQPNERWQADVTHWQLADGTDTEILNIIDDHSRLVIGSHARHGFKAADVVVCFQDAFTRHGLPASVLTDNGAIFTATPRGQGRVAFEKLLDLLGIRAVRSRPYHPQTCGKVERFHQTQKRWLTAHDPAATVAELQDLLDAFTDVYNTKRPHRALERATPAQAYTARPKTGPNGIGTEPHYRVRYDTINNGTVTVRHNSRLHHIGVGKQHTGTPVMLLIADLDIRVITHHGDLLRHLTLDPTRDYQPRGVKPGPPARKKWNDVARHV